MIIPENWLESPATCFAIFFAISFTILGLILLAATPALFRSLRKHLRQGVARIRRSGRTLAELPVLQEQGREIEGMLFFPDSDEENSDQEEGSSGLTSDAA